MNNMLTKWLSALLIAALFMTPVAMMEEAPAGEPVAAETETQTEDVPEVVPEDVPEEAPEETDDVPEAAVIPEAVDAVVTEACDIALDEVTEDALSVEASDEAEEGDALIPEAQIVEESLDDITEYEAAEESAKAMAEAAGEIPIDAAHFPDAGFRELISWKYDKDKNGYLSDSERIAPVSPANPNLKLPELATMSIDYNYSIQSLVGIEYFKFQAIQANSQTLTSVDLSAYDMSNLVAFSAGGQLTTLILGNCPNLEVITVYGQDDKVNLSGDLDLTGCPKMRYLSIWAIGNLKRILVNPNSELVNIKFVGWWNTETNHPETDFPRSIAPKHYEHKKYKWEGAPYGITCPHNTKIVTNIYIPADGVTQVSATKKSSKATVNAGTTFQINPGATAGKKFKSSKKKVATVSSNGIVTAKAKGKTKITFKVGKKKRTLTLTVNDPTIPQSVTLSAPTTAVKKGDTVTLTPAVPEGTNPGGYKWKSSNKKVATVNNGVVTFKKAGKVTITCTTVRGKKKARVAFAVSK